MSLQASLQFALHLTDDETQEAANYFLPYTYPKNTTFLETGKEAKQLFFLTEGYIRIHADFEGKEITQWISAPGYFITDLSSWLFNQPARWNFTTLTEVSLVAISKEDYQHLQSIIASWHEKERNFIGHCFHQMEQRIFQFLSQNSEERYLAFCKDYAFLFNQVPHQYIASLLGMTPETLSRLRRQQR
ncbi:Crp/Fnr family transcriptional regulator [Myroides sp. 1354]|uniref:Crp/Fnr family transcriptional regulator n=1 Tax=unclassified Myroides TaxID=2642485 RepID=UPI002578CA14|nr:MULTISPECIES: Crp/Fnr family transcriptional regulator [unclassified Myroides]MDM1045720.1 Crp/Fnr family transcriptional regulator [Myroides sp. R163-1]MDM1056722.1 Crp/Fnr family transcriptional regulator [Myroides sp. 1354]MDM1070514.1 Crp/Fnr family transcriptional regulator [Myroides sp. 1372]